MHTNRLQQSKISGSHKKQHQIWKRIVAGLACIVTFATTYMLILPALTLDKTTYCGMEEHRHDESCYEEKLACGLEECEEPHTHTEECYEEKEILVCGKKESDGHEHTAKCISEEKTLECSEDHEHTDDCYLIEETYVCDLEEGDGAHTHDEDCYKLKQVLTCELKECEEAHTHAEDCYKLVPVCGIKEHKHSKSCFIDETEAEETKNKWEQAAENVELSGIWADDVLMIAKSQIGYKESTEDYIVDDDGHVKGYTIYGDLNGDPYGDWNEAFVVFCLNHAEVPTYAEIYDLLSNVESIMQKESEAEEPETEETTSSKFHSAGKYLPQTGDIVFFDSDLDGCADRTGIISTVNEEASSFRMIEGDRAGEVQRSSSYKISDKRVVGFYSLINDEKKTEEPVDTEFIDKILGVLDYADLSEILDYLEDKVLKQAELMEEFEISSLILSKADDAKISDGIDDVEVYDEADDTEVVDSAADIEEIPEGIEIINETEAIEETVSEDGEIEVLIDADEMMPFNEEEGIEVISEEDKTDDIDEDGESAISFEDDDMISDQLEEDEVYNETTESISTDKPPKKTETGSRKEKLRFFEEDEDTELSDEDDGIYITDKRLRAFSRKVSLAENEIEESHAEDAITDDEHDELSERLASIYDAFIMLAEKKPGLETTAAPPEVVAPDYIGTIKTANRWQIVDQEYTANKNSNKKGYDVDGDGLNDVLIQKNVVPTENENEFLVYLSATKMMTWDTLLASSQMGLTPQGKWTEADVGKVVNYSQVGGNKTNVLSPGEGTNTYIATIELWKNGEKVHTYIGKFNGKTPKASQCTGYIVLTGTDKVIIASVGVNLHTDGSGSGGTLKYTIDLDKMEGNNICYAINEIELDSVEDQLGDYIVYQGVKKCDGTATESNGIITWDIAENKDITGINYNITVSKDPIFTGYIENVAQLVYRVKLDVSKQNFNSCAGNINSKIGDKESYKVNDHATLNFTIDSKSYSKDFPVPYVRGTLYNIRFKKVSDKGKDLGGAIFGLYQEDGKIPIVGSDGNPLKVTTKAGEISGFIDLPYGTYVLKEDTPPPHYNPGATSTWTMPLCYTNDQKMTTLVLDETDKKNLRYKKNDNKGSVWEIVNIRGEYTYSLKVIKTDDENHYLDGVQFNVTNPEGGTALSGSTDDNGSIAFTGVFRAGIEYTLTEVKAPDGYNMLPADIRFKVIDDPATETQTLELVNKVELQGLVRLELSEDSGKSTLVVNVINMPGYKLPETGGYGTKPFTLGGLAMTGGALMYIYNVRRKRGRRAE